MRTTLTLDPDVAERLRRETASGRRTLKEVVNERLRIGFGLVTEEPRAPYRVQPHASPFRPGVDPMKLNQLIDELEAEDAPHRGPGTPEK
jgi:hypothetical protein